MVSVFYMKISWHVTQSLKWCSLALRFFVYGLFLWFDVISRAPLLSSKTLHLIVGAILLTGKICCFISCSNFITGMTFLRICDGPLYSDSVEIYKLQFEVVISS